MTLPQLATLYDNRQSVIKWRGNIRKYRRAKFDEDVGVISKGVYIILPLNAHPRENDIIIIEGEEERKYRIKAINEQYGRYGLHHYTVEVVAF
jgi:hypothetical protein